MYSRVGPAVIRIFMSEVSKKECQQDAHQSVLSTVDREAIFAHFEMVAIAGRGDVSGFSSAVFGIRGVTGSWPHPSSSALRDEPDRLHASGLQIR